MSTNPYRIRHEAREAIAAAGLTVAGVSRAAQLPYQSVVSVLLGYRRPSWRIMSGIAGVLGVEPADLFEEAVEIELDELLEA